MYHKDGQTDRQTDMQRHIDSQTTARQAGKQKYRWTDKQKYRQRNRGGNL